MQLGLFLEAATPLSPPESAENEHGVLVDVETIALPGKPRAARYGGGNWPISKIDLAYADDVWHWGIDIHTTSFGCGFAPSRKWKRVAATRQLAIIDAAECIRERVKEANYPNQKEIRAINQWLDQVLAGDLQQVAA